MPFRIVCGYLKDIANLRPKNLSPYSVNTKIVKEESERAVRLKILFYIKEEEADNNLKHQETCEAFD